MRYGSMCTGGGGLELAVGMLWPDAELAWVAEDDRHAAALLEARFPGVPNLGDLTAVDWHAVEPVDVVTAGFPCQDLSYAGRGAGIVEGSRSGLWYVIERAVRVLRPRLVLLENVAAIVGRRPGLDVVLAGLAEGGFDAQWATLRASDVGAPHRRERWFCVAYAAGEQVGTAGLARPRAGRAAADTERLGRAGRRAPGNLAGAPRGGQGQGDQRERDGAAADDRGATAPDASLDGRPEGWAGAGERAGDTGQPASHRGVTANADGGGLQECSEPDGGTERPGLESSRRSDAHGRDQAAADTERIGRLDRRLGEPHAGGEAGHAQGRRPAGRRWRARYGGRDVDYTPAIERWEAVLGRPAPAPTDDRGRLSPPFVEWMMGWPEGWVDGLPRTQALKILGNGAVPQQAAAAYALLLERPRTEVAA